MTMNRSIKRKRDAMELIMSMSTSSLSRSLSSPTSMDTEHYETSHESSNQELEFKFKLFQDLPTDLHNIILDHLDVPALGTLVIVSSYFNNLAKRDEFWSKHLKYLHENHFDGRLEMFETSNKLSLREQRSTAVVEWMNDCFEYHRGSLLTLDNIYEVEFEDIFDDEEEPEEEFYCSFTREKYESMSLEEKQKFIKDWNDDDYMCCSTPDYMEEEFFTNDSFDSPLAHSELFSKFFCEPDCEICANFRNAPDNQWLFRDVPLRIYYKKLGELLCFGTKNMREALLYEDGATTAGYARTHGFKIYDYKHIDFMPKISLFQYRYANFLFDYKSCE